MPNPDQALLHTFTQGDRLAFLAPDQALLRSLGALVVGVDRSTGEVVLEFTPGAEFLQGLGVIQGGVVSAMLDFAMGFAGLAMMEPGVQVTTATLTVAFLRRADAGTYIAKGLIERRGRSLLFARGELRNEAGLLVASGTASLAVLAR